MADGIGLPRGPGWQKQQFFASKLRSGWAWMKGSMPDDGSARKYGRDEREQGGWTETGRGDGRVILSQSSPPAASCRR
jgi:hypothetical protein